MRDEQFCYLTTTGRVTGKTHRIEIWFATEDDRTLLLAAGGRRSSDWVKNLAAQPDVDVEIAGLHHTARARMLDQAEPDDVTARRLLLDKYGPDGLHDWARTSLVVALDLALGHL